MMRYLQLRARALSAAVRHERSPHWVKVKNPKAPIVMREAKEDWGRR